MNPWLLSAVLVLALLQLCLCKGIDQKFEKFANVPSFRRVLRGDNEQLNAILRRARAIIPPQELDTEVNEKVGPLDLKLKVMLGNKYDEFGECYNFAVNGDLQIEGEQKPDEMRDGKRMQRYDVTLLGTGIQVSCDAVVRIRIEEIKWGFIKIKGKHLGQRNDPGNLNLFSPNISIKYTFSLFSEDFTRQPPTMADPNGKCSLGLGNMRFKSKGVLSIFQLKNFNNKGIQLDDKVEDALKKNPGLIKGPAAEGICNQLITLGKELTNLVMFNELTVAMDSGALGNSTSTEEQIQQDAIQAEKRLPITDNMEPLDISQFESILDQFSSNNGTDGNIDFLDQIMGGKLDGGVTEMGITALNEKFGTNVRTDLHGVEVVELINTVVLKKPKKDPLIVVNQSVLTDDLKLNIFLGMNRLTIDKTSNNSIEESLLEELEIAGKHSLILPDVELGDFSIYANITVKLTVDLLTGLEGFLPPFKLDIDETFVIDSNLYGLLIGLGGMIPIDMLAVKRIQLGPMLEHPFDCFSSSLFNPISLSAFVVDTRGIDAIAYGFKDLFGFILGDMINVVSFLYQSVPAKLLQEFVEDKLIRPGFPLLAEGTCPIARNIHPSKMYDFSKGVFAMITEFIDENVLEFLLDWALNTGGDEKDIYSLIKGYEHHYFNVLPIDGWTQRVDINLTKLDIGGILPPKINRAEVSVPTWSKNYPQGIVASVDAFDASHPVSFTFGMNLSMSKPFVVDKSVSTKTAPSIFDEGSNHLEITLGLEHVQGVADIFAKLTQYAVDSMTIGKIFRFECWSSRLLSPGGWKELKVILDGIHVDFKCNCTTPIILKLERAMESHDGWDQLLQVLQEVADSLLGKIVDRHSDENFDATVATARAACEAPSLGFLSGSASDETLEEENHPLGAYLLIGVIIVSLLVKMSPCCLSFTLPCQVKTKAEQFSLDESARVAMFRHPLIQKYIRYSISILLVINLSMFIYGDTGVALVLGFDAFILGAPFQAKEYGSYSIISSTVELYNSGAVGLALFITLLVIAWPFIKLIALSICWFTPPTNWKTLKLRGNVLHFMDAVGKWSLLELFIVMLLMFLFNIDIGSPKNQFLPADDMWSITVNFDAQLSFYVFTAAVVLSICLSNTLTTYHQKIVHHSEDTFGTGDKLGKIKAAPARNIHLLSVSNRLEMIVLAVLIVSTILILVSGLASDALVIDYYGLIAFLMRLEGETSTLTFSSFSMLKQLFQGIEAYGFGYFFMGMVFFISQVLFPLLVIFASVYAICGKFDIKGARKIQNSLPIIRAWSAVEVFSLALIIGVIEIESIAKGLQTDECNALKPFLQQVLMPLDLVSEADVDAACFGIELNLLGGIYLLIFANLLLSVLSVMLEKQFAFAIDMSLHEPVEIPENANHTPEYLNHKLHEPQAKETIEAETSFQGVKVAVV